MAECMSADIIQQRVSTNAADVLRKLTEVRRKRNGRLDIDWIDRTQKPRWKQVAFNGQWYNRDKLRQMLARRPKPEVVPASRRPLTGKELDAVRDPAPWRLGPPEAYEIIS